MYSRPSTSTTREPLPLATKYGVPPTERKARTGEFTPPGMMREARRKSSSFVTNSPEHVGELGREVGEDDVGAGTLDGGDVLEGDGLTVDPPALGRRLDHRVLAGHVVGGDGNIDCSAHVGDHIEVGERRLHHDD